jgi:signal transduction protein with GAF and PtsI domain
MKKQLINYETLTTITAAISATREPSEIVLMTVEGVKTALDVKGCSVFLINRQTDELEIAGSYGLSQEYLDKGPISALQSIAASLKEGPVAIYDVTDDPRIQYPKAATKEGIGLHCRALGIYIGRCQLCPGRGPDHRNGN